MSDQDQIQAGDIVEVKSGNSPRMTVGKLQGEVAICVWFPDEKSPPLEKSFFRSVLKKVTSST